MLVDKFFLYELYNEALTTYFKGYNYVGLVCREFDKDNVAKVRENFNKTLVFISVGRSVSLEKEINVEGLPYNFIVTEGLKLKGKNVTYIPIETENTHDYIKASDYGITKAGCGTVAECLCCW